MLLVEAQKLLEFKNGTSPDYEDFEGFTSLDEKLGDKEFWPAWGVFPISGDHSLLYLCFNEDYQVINSGILDGSQTISIFRGSIIFDGKNEKKYTVREFMDILHRNYWNFRYNVWKLKVCQLLCEQLGGRWSDKDDCSVSSLCQLKQQVYKS